MMSDGHGVLFWRIDLAIKYKTTLIMTQIQDCTYTR